MSGFWWGVVAGAIAVFGYLVVVGTVRSTRSEGTAAFAVDSRIGVPADPPVDDDPYGLGFNPIDVLADKLKDKASPAVVGCFWEVKEVVDDDGFPLLRLDLVGMDGRGVLASKTRSLYWFEHPHTVDSSNFTGVESNPYLGFLPGVTWRDEIQVHGRLAAEARVDAELTADFVRWAEEEIRRRRFGKPHPQIRVVG
jgi:hypothetical protein